jgi:RNA polymerase sigma-70 factor (ECF subfamily)
MPRKVRVQAHRMSLPQRPPPGASGLLDVELARERPRLVALCARLTGDPFAAEDLAQETLLEAWRHVCSLRESTHLHAWLSGIARNVCLRWQRAQGRERSHRAATDPAMPGNEHQQNDRFVDEADIDSELERKELIELLDYALASLPPVQREALIAQYVWDLPLAEIAARSGISVPAATMRVQRAKLVLHRILSTTLRAKIAPYLVDVTIAGWQETRLWCFVCGRQHLRGQVSDDGSLLLTCPTCIPSPKGAFFNTCWEIWGHVKGYGRAMSRTLDWMGSYYQLAQPKQTVTCYVCGTETPLRSPVPLAPADWGVDRVLGLFHRCQSCGAECSQPLAGLALATPAGRHFQQEHPRMRILPELEIEVDGFPAVVARFASLTNLDTLDVIFSYDSGRLLYVLPGP